MSVLAVKEVMLYCPKCQQTYEDGTQRFCTNEGNRLLPAPSAEKSVKQSGGVFTSLLGRVAPTDEIDNKLSPNPKFAKITLLPPPVIAPSKPTTLKAGQILKPKSETPPTPRPQVNAEPPANVHLPIQTKTNLQSPSETQSAQPLPRIVKPEEITASQATLGDRQIEPSGRPALTISDPQVLVGQTVKGRYFVLEKLEEEESSIVYLAEDKLAVNRKVIVKILMNEDENDNFANKIFAEERVSLSLIVHPNIARVFDSGELQEGKSFIISEFVEGKSVKEMLGQTGQFNGLRTARIIRQVAYALSEVHQNGILHRNLKPENIMLTVSEIGSEQVKLTNFGIAKENPGNKNLDYKSPEQVNGNLASFASDIYSLATVAYQMLTNRLPFNNSSVETLRTAQKSGLKIHPTNLRLDLPPLVDEILEKALAYNPSDRYPKARDFGDAFYNALSTVAPWEKHIKSEGIEIITVENEAEPSEIIKPEIALPVSETITKTSPAEILPVISDIHISPRVVEDQKVESGSVKATEDLAWERRSPELPKLASSSRTWLAILGLLILFAGIWGIWRYVLSRPGETVDVQTTTEKTNAVESAPQNSPSLLEDMESPPIPRTITQPPNSVYFQNSKNDLKGDMAKNFLGFSLYYPTDWKQNPINKDQEKGVRGKFLDISKSAPNGLPIEQILISYYDSKGTFKADSAIFPDLVKETNDSLNKNDRIPNYQVVSQGEEPINNGWRSYKLIFQGESKTSGGEQVMIWGKRLWIPTSRAGMKNGYAITMLATSLSPDVKSAEDVGVKGELAAILATFEPNQNF